MDNVTGAIREVLYYNRRFAGQIIVIAFDQLPLTDTQKANLTMDVRVLKETSLNVVLVCPDPTVREWLTFQCQRKPWSEIKPPSFHEGTVIIAECTRQEDGFSVAADLAIILQGKPFFLIGADGVFDVNKQLIRQVTAEDAQQLLDSKKSNNRSVVTGDPRKALAMAVHCCQNGVERVHIINRQKPGAILEELFTGSGKGTMVCRTIDDYLDIRPAKTSDIPGIVNTLNLCATEVPPAMSSDTVKDFFVFMADETIHGCFRLNTEKHDLVVNYLAVTPPFQDNPSVFAAMLDYAISQASDLGLQRVIVSCDKGSYNQWCLFVHPVLMQKGFVKDRSGHRWKYEPQTP